MNLTVELGLRVATPAEMENVCDGEDVTDVIFPLEEEIVTVFPLYIRHVLSLHHLPR